MQMQEPGAVLTSIRWGSMGAFHAEDKSTGKISHIISDDKTPNRMIRCGIRFGSLFSPHQHISLGYSFTLEGHVKLTSSYLSLTKWVRVDGIHMGNIEWWLLMANSFRTYCITHVMTWQHYTNIFHVHKITTTFNPWRITLKDNGGVGRYKSIICYHTMISG